MYHAPKRPCSYGGIIYSFFGICQHIFLKKISITDSVPIYRAFSVLHDIAAAKETKSCFDLLPL